MQEHVRERLACNASAVDLHDVVPPHNGVELADMPVHADATAADQVVGATARGDSGASEEGVQSHRLILAGVGLPP